MATNTAKKSQPKEMVTVNQLKKIELSLREGPKSFKAFRSDIRAHGITVTNRGLKVLIKTEFPAFGVDENGIVSKKYPSAKAVASNTLKNKYSVALKDVPSKPKRSLDQRIKMVQRILNEKCPITIAEIRGIMKREGFSISDADLRTGIKTQLPDFSIHETLVRRVQASIQNNKTKTNKHRLDHVARLESILRQGCPMKMHHIRAQLYESGFSMDDPTINNIIEKELPEFKEIFNYVIDFVQGGNNTVLLQNFLKENCPITKREARAKLNICVIQLNDRDFTFYLEARLPEFSLVEEGMIIWKRDPCLLALQSIAKPGCPMDIVHIMQHLNARGISRTEAKIRLIIKTCLPGLKLEDENSTIETSIFTDESETDETCSEYSCEDESDCDEDSTTTSAVELIQRTLNEKCPTAITEIRMVLVSHSFAINRSVLSDLIVKDMGNHLIVEGFVYRSNSMSKEGLLIANVVLEAIYPLLATESPHSIGSLISVLAVKGIELSKEMLEEIISKYSFTCKCQEGFVISFDNRKQERENNLKSLEEIVLLLKSLEFDENNSFRDANQGLLFKKRFLDDILGKNDVYKLLSCLIISEEGIGLSHDPEEQASNEEKKLKETPSQHVDQGAKVEEKRVKEILESPSFAQRENQYISYSASELEDQNPDISNTNDTNPFTQTCNDN